MAARNVIQIPIYPGGGDGHGSRWVTEEEIGEEKAKAFCHFPRNSDPNFGLLGSTNLSSWSHFAEHQTQKILKTLPEASQLPYKDYILLFGGIVDELCSEAIFLYVPQENSWVFCGKMPCANSNHAAALLQNKVYITGGYSPGDTQFDEMSPSSSTYSFCLDRMIWREHANMNQARAFHAMVEFKDQLFVFGGRGTEGCGLVSVECFHPSRNEWQEIATMPDPMIGMGAVCFNGAIWLIAGATLTQCDYHFSSSVMVFDPYLWQWTRSSDLTRSKAYVGAVVLRDEIYVIGGAEQFNTANMFEIRSLSEIESFSLSANAWNCQLELFVARHSSAVVASDSKIFVFGGMDTTSKHTCQVMDAFEVDSGQILRDYMRIPMSIAGCSAVYVSAPTLGDFEFMERDLPTYPLELPAKSTCSLRKIADEFRAQSFHEILPEADTFDSAISSESSQMSQDENSNEYSAGLYHSFSESKLNVGRSFFVDSPTERRSSYVDISVTRSKPSFESIPSERLDENDFTTFDDFEDLDREREDSRHGYISTFTLDDLQSRSRYKPHKEIDEYVESEEQLPTSSPGFFKEDLDFSKLIQIDVEHEVIQKNTPNKKRPIKGTSRYAISHEIEITQFQKGVSHHRKVKRNLMIPDGGRIQELIFDADFGMSTEIIKSAQLSVSDSEERLYEELRDIKRAYCTEEVSVPVTLLVGGLSNFGTGNSILKYDYLKNVWEFAGGMFKPRLYHSVVLIECVIYVAGGIDLCLTLQGKVCATDSLISYDLRERLWRTRSRMNHSRAHHSAAVVADRMYVIGGRDFMGRILDAVEVYDPLENRWSFCKALPYPLMGAASCVSGQRIYIIGGITVTQGRQKITERVCIYDTTNDSWLVGASLPLPLCYGSSTLMAHQLWLFGGLTMEGESTRDVGSIMKLTNGSWNIVAQLTIPRHSISAVTIGSRAFLLGGITNSDTLDVVDVMSASLQINSGRPIPVPLIGAAALVLPPQAVRVYTREELDNIMNACSLPQ